MASTTVESGVTSPSSVGGGGPVGPQTELFIHPVSLSLPGESTRGPATLTAIAASANGVYIGTASGHVYAYRRTPESPGSARSPGSGAATGDASGSDVSRELGSPIAVNPVALEPAPLNASDSSPVGPQILLEHESDTCDLKEGISALAVAPDRTVVAGTTGGIVAVVSPADGTTKNLFKHPCEVTAVLPIPALHCVISGDCEGLVMWHPVVAAAGGTHPIQLCSLGSEIVQMDAADVDGVMMLLIACRSRCVVLRLLHGGEATGHKQVGKRLRNGEFGACFGRRLDVDGATESCVVWSARPGRRMWLAQALSGVVEATLRFSPAPGTAPTDLTLSCTPAVVADEDRSDIQIGRVLPVRCGTAQPYLVSWWSTYVAVLQPGSVEDTGGIPVWCETSAVHSVAVAPNLGSGPDDIFVLHSVGDTRTLSVLRHFGRPLPARLAPTASIFLRSPSKGRRAMEGAGPGSAMSVSSMDSDPWLPWQSIPQLAADSKTDDEVSLPSLRRRHDSISLASVASATKRSARSVRVRDRNGLMDYAKLSATVVGRVPSSPSDPAMYEVNLTVFFDESTGRSVLTMHRYSDFIDLHHELCQHVATRFGFELPPKQLVGSHTESTVRYRAMRFEAYLAHALKIRAVTLHPAFQTFVHLDKALG